MVLLLLSGQCGGSTAKVDVIWVLVVVVNVDVRVIHLNVSLEDPNTNIANGPVSCDLTQFNTHHHDILPLLPWIVCILSVACLQHDLRSGPCPSHLDLLSLVIVSPSGTIVVHPAFISGVLLPFVLLNQFQAVILVATVCSAFLVLELDGVLTVLSEELTDTVCVITVQLVIVGERKELCKVGLTLTADHL